MAVTRAKKESILRELTDKFGKAKAVYFAKNKGLAVKKVSDLRKTLHKDNVEMMVAKKTLMRLAVRQNNLPELPDELMDGPVSATFGYDDVVVPVKLLHAFAKENENLEILGGVVEGRIVSRAEAKQLATLPSREELLAKLVGSMQSPIYGFHGAASGILRKLVYALKAIQEKKPA